MSDNRFSSEIRRSNLITPIRIPDGMIRDIPGGDEKFEECFDQAFKAFAVIYRLGDPVDFTGEFLYRGRRPNDVTLAPGDIDYLSRLFGTRSRFYPHCGH